MFLLKLHSQWTCETTVLLYKVCEMDLLVSSLQVASIVATNHFVNPISDHLTKVDSEKEKVWPEKQIYENEKGYYLIALKMICSSDQPIPLLAVFLNTVVQ